MEAFQNEGEAEKGEEVEGEGPGWQGGESEGVVEGDRRVGGQFEELGGVEIGDRKEERAEERKEEEEEGAAHEKGEKEIVEEAQEGEAVEVEEEEREDRQIHGEADRKRLSEEGAKERGVLRQGGQGFVFSGFPFGEKEAERLLDRGKEEEDAEAAQVAELEAEMGGGQRVEEDLDQEGEA